MKDQARRLSQLEDMLKEAQLHPTPRRRCIDSEEETNASLERKVTRLNQELQVNLSTPHTVLLSRRTNFGCHVVLHQRTDIWHSYTSLQEEGSARDGQAEQDC